MESNDVACSICQALPPPPPLIAVVVTFTDARASSSELVLPPDPTHPVISSDCDVLKLLVPCPNSSVLDCKLFVPWSDSPLKGLTLVHSSAPRKYLLWDVLGGVSTCNSVINKSQMYLKSGRVKAPALKLFVPRSNSNPSLLKLVVPRSNLQRRKQKLKEKNGKPLIVFWFQAQKAGTFNTGFNLHRPTNSSLFAAAITPSSTKVLVVLI